MLVEKTWNHVVSEKEFGIFGKKTWLLPCISTLYLDDRFCQACI